MKQCMLNWVHSKSFISGSYYYKRFKVLNDNTKAGADSALSPRLLDFNKRPPCEMLEPYQNPVGRTQKATEHRQNSSKQQTPVQGPDETFGGQDPREQ